MYIVISCKSLYNGTDANYTSLAKQYLNDCHTLPLACILQNQTMTMWIIIYCYYEFALFFYLHLLCWQRLMGENIWLETTNWSSQLKKAIQLVKQATSFHSHVCHLMIQHDLTLLWASIHFKNTTFKGNPRVRLHSALTILLWP